MANTGVGAAQVSRLGLTAACERGPPLRCEPSQVGPADAPDSESRRDAAEAPLAQGRPTSPWLTPMATSSPHSGRWNPRQLWVGVRVRGSHTEHRGQRTPYVGLSCTLLERFLHPVRNPQASHHSFQRCTLHRKTERSRKPLPCQQARPSILSASSKGIEHTHPVAKSSIHCLVCSHCVAVVPHVLQPVESRCTAQHHRVPAACGERRWSLARGARQAGRRSHPDTRTAAHQTL